MANSEDLANQLKKILEIRPIWEEKLGWISRENLSSTVEWKNLDKGRLTKRQLFTLIWITSYLYLKVRCR